MHSAMAFSGDADDIARARARLGPPDNEAPAAVGVSGVIGRSIDAAILLMGLARYTTGLQVELAIRCRLDLDPADLTYSTLDGGLLAGVQLADGRTAVAGRFRWDDGLSADEPLLTHQSGGGGGREWSTNLWLSPAPPPGDLVLVVAHPALGVDESSFTVDGEALRAAAGRVEVLWPREPDRDHALPEPAVPEVAAGGWFERAWAPAEPKDPR
ncbi:hypothetical protein [Cellulomonas alba]|uniref:Uncharacterized protein n=1 Tax=Cellulomonas alba TaxID=3053467 RepID=A0ABT7SH80_9CELL|nr:hypothetical protein [Cellulomonas alba]MDM7855496.1 hypothetical protein [Cellulomonas alba]